MNRVKLEQVRRDGDTKVGLIERLLSQPRHLIVTILIHIGKEIPPAGAVIRLQNISSNLERGTRQATQEIRIRW